MPADTAKDKKTSGKTAIQTTLKTLKEIFRARPYRYIIFLLLFIAVSLLPFASSYLQKDIIDELISILDSDDLGNENLIKLIALSVVLQIAINQLWSLITYLEEDLRYKLQKHFTFKFLEKSGSLDMYHFENPEQNTTIQKAKEAYTWRPTSFARRFGYIFRDFVTLVTSISIVATFSPIMFGILLITSVPALVVNIDVAKKNWHIWNDEAINRKKYWNVLWYLTDSSSLMELRIFKAGKLLLTELEDMYNRFLTKEEKVAKKSILKDSVSKLISSAGTIGFWIFTILKVLSREITIGSLSFYTGTANKFTNALTSMFRRIAKTYEDVKYMNDFYKFIDMENTILDGSQKLPEKPSPPEIVFKHVDFTYPESEKPVLENFELTIKPGERIAFVGENGAGKSTIVKLLTRFYDVTGGSITINGIDLRKLKLSDWYKKVGILNQDFSHFGFYPAGKNIAIGDPKNIGDSERIRDAANMSGADQFIIELDNKYEQILDKRFEEGTDLSGGQWQRMALARGFFRDSDVIILDEPTSAIDAKGELEIFERLYEFTENKTVIIISHRFSTVRMADKIYVIDEGKIVESGTHEELMKLDGKYAESFRAQAKSYQ